MATIVATLSTTNETWHMILKEDKACNQQVLAVTTRQQQYEREKEEAMQLTKQMTSRATSTSMGDLFDFAGNIFIGEGKAKKSKQARRKLKRENRKSTEMKNEDTNCSKEELIRLQKSDPTLDKIGEMVSQGHGTAKSMMGYCIDISNLIWKKRQRVYYSLSCQSNTGGRMGVSTSLFCVVMQHDTPRQCR